MYCTCIFKQGSPASSRRRFWQYCLYENLYLEKAEPSKLFLCQLYSIINETTQHAWDFPGSRYSHQKYVFTLFSASSGPWKFTGWSQRLCWFSILPRLWDWFLVTLLWLKSGNSWMSAEQACQGLTSAQHSPGDSLFVNKSCFTGRLKRAPA